MPRPSLETARLEGRDSGGARSWPGRAGRGGPRQDVGVDL